MAELRSIRVTAFTHRGVVRSRNEDAIAVGPWVATGEMHSPTQFELPVERPVLCLVADGIGGHAAGDRASLLAARELAARVGDLRDIDRTDAIKTMLHEVNREIYDDAEADAARRGMGTTVAGCLFDRNGIHWFNVGDSRIYRYHNKFASQLSVDDADETRSNVITQALGGWDTFRKIEPHTGKDQVKDGWCYLLCSDGLTDLVGRREMQDVLRRKEAETTRVTALFQQAMNAGGHDNVSIILVRVTATEASAGEPSEIEQ